MQDSDVDDRQVTAPASRSPLLTTAEVADYLRVKERTIYEMVAKQTIPFSKATGKLLFPRRLVDAWLEAQTELPATGVAPAPPIYAGSNDPLLEWSLRQAGTGLAVLANGSTHGLEELAAGRAVLAGCHLLDPATGSWNRVAVKAHLPGGAHVVIHWARRTQGLMTAPGNPLGITGLEDAVARSLRFAVRADGAGSQRLLEVLLHRAGLALTDLERVARPAETHADLAALIETGEADCGLGLEAAAGQLGFIPLLADDSFDLVMPAATISSRRSRRSSRSRGPRPSPGGWRISAGTIRAISAGSAGMAEPLVLHAAGSLAAAMRQQHDHGLDRPRWLKSPPDAVAASRRCGGWP